jgi:ornithine decarboxylase
MTWMIKSFGDKMGFDCASINEMETVDRISKSVDIIYAQPCKTAADIQSSKRFNAKTTVVDSPEEMEKLCKENWLGNVLIRLLVPDTNSRQPFSKKFGAPLEWVPQILALAASKKIPITGLSFHVGSECENPEQFARALQVCRQAMDIGCNHGVQMDTIDIGGGFLPTETNLSSVAKSLAEARAKHFVNNLSPTKKPIQWIAEPGRFLSSTTQSLYCPIIGRKRGIPSTDPTAPEIRYTLNESVYGYFSNIPFDGQKPNFEIVHSTRKAPNCGSLFRSILFGRTCDGADVICPSIKLPLLEEGDWLKIDNMGAYTNVTASEFNGFPKPETIYVE